jgi:ubiquinone/menaquinone biosynthesis C-methylase UbiE
MKQMALAHERVFAGEFAEEYARKHVKIAAKFGREYAEELAARGFQRGRILDAGCGFGTTATMLAQRFPESHVVGIDLSEPLLALAEQEAQAAGVGDRACFKRADVERIPYERDAFDVVLNVQMLHIVEHPVWMLNELERVLAPDGALLVADIRRSWVGWLDKTFRSGLTLREATALMRQSGVRDGAFSSSLLWWRFEA